MFFLCLFHCWIVKQHHSKMLFHHFSWGSCVQSSCYCNDRFCSCFFVQWRESKCLWFSSTGTQYYKLFLNFSLSLSHCFWYASEELYQLGDVISPSWYTHWEFVSALRMSIAFSRTYSPRTHFSLCNQLSIHIFQRKMHSNNQSKQNHQQHPFKFITITVTKSHYLCYEHDFSCYLWNK